MGSNEGVEGKSYIIRFVFGKKAEFMWFSVENELKEARAIGKKALRSLEVGSRSHHWRWREVMES